MTCVSYPLLATPCLTWVYCCLAHDVAATCYPMPRSSLQDAVDHDDDLPMLVVDHVEDLPMLVYA